MDDAILVLNAGSSSLKFSVFGVSAQLPVLLRGAITALSSRAHFTVRDAQGKTIVDRPSPASDALAQNERIEQLFGWIRKQLPDHRLVAVGHRVVHGGSKFDGPVRVDADVMTRLERLIPLAPLHQPHNLEAIRTAQAQGTELDHVACFDTAFHQPLPWCERTYGLPRKWTQSGLVRFGFHGISYQSIAQRLQSCDPQLAAGKAVVAHLGSGASMCALDNGRSVATTMGLTPLDGLPMSTRCGAIDPGALLYLMDHHGMDARALETLLYERSGWLGVSGISSDMRTLLEHSEGSAAEAVDLFVYRIGRELGSLAAAMGGLDGLVFTGAIGANAAQIRGRVCATAAWLGLELDPAANEAGGPRLHSDQSRISIWALETDEERVIAEQTRALLAGC
jgi:acetate kinase